jgi:hypothetical protein
MAVEQMGAVINGWILLKAASYSATHDIPTVVNFDEDILTYAEVAFVNKPNLDGDDVSIGLPSNAANNGASSIAQFTETAVIPVFPGKYVPVVAGTRGTSKQIYQTRLPATCTTISIYGGSSAYTPGTLYIYGRK